jgi:hypothetical protein
MIIGAIYELDGVTPKVSHQFRVGRKGLLYPLSKGEPAIFEYSERDGYLMTSLIQSFEENDYGVWVTTLNSIYRFDY